MPRKPTAERAFKAKYPRATITCTGTWGNRGHWEIRYARSYAFIPNVTRARAWQIACDREGIDYHGRKEKP